MKTDKSFKNIHSDGAGILHAKIVACKKVNIFSVICITKRGYGKLQRNLKKIGKKIKNKTIWIDVIRN